MAIRYQIDKKKYVTFILWTGKVTAYDFASHIYQITTDKDWQNSRLILANLRITFVDKSIDHQVLEEVATYFGTHPLHLAGRKLAVITENELEKVMLFSKILLEYGTSVRAFKYVDEAVKWADVDLKEAALRFKELEETPW